MEECQYLDEELDGLVAEIQEKFDDLKKTDKKLTASARTDKIDYIQDRIARAKDVLANFRVELREVLREGGREEHAEFEAKGKAHNQAVNKLLADTETIKAAADKRELIKGAKAKKKGEKEVEVKDQVLNEGKQIQEKSGAALDRTAKMVEEMGELGCETNINLKRQTEQMSNTNADVVGVQNEMKRASKVGRDIARRLATDKLIICLVLVLILAIIGVIVGKTIGFDVVSASVLDCALSGFVDEKCLNVTNAPSPTPRPPYVAPPGVVGGGGPGAVLTPCGSGSRMIQLAAPDCGDPKTGYFLGGVCGDYKEVFNTSNCTVNYCNETTTTPIPATTPVPDTNSSTVNSTNTTDTVVETTPEPACPLELCLYCIWTARPVATTTPPPVVTTNSSDTSANSTNATDTTGTGSRRLLMLDAVIRGGGVYTVEDGAVPVPEDERKTRR